MFISIDQIRDSLKYLQKVDSFWGITFLKFKQLRLPVGNTIEISLNKEIKDFLEKYYQHNGFLMTQVGQKLIILFLKRLNLN
jgi:hypothetical protein